ncbi:hypothetical protein [Ralstonia solanacearum]|uniref:hypothetical protein n=1 Tax=Ralstonia solanacearum TaxID=305 RepID=UPI0018D1934F|nr:hypothetical protein [Ralstonia solanacearum]
MTRTTATPQTRDHAISFAEKPSMRLLCAILALSGPDRAARHGPLLPEAVPDPRAKAAPRLGASPLQHRRDPPRSV